MKPIFLENAHYADLTRKQDLLVILILTNSELQLGQHSTFNQHFVSIVTS